MLPHSELRGDIWHVLPRGMRFERASATSIDLFVAELAAHSRFACAVFAEFVSDPLQAAELIRLAVPSIRATADRVRAVARYAVSKRSGLIVVQQHLPTAAGLANQVTVPVLLQKHNFMRPPRAGVPGSLSRWRNSRMLDRLAGLTFVSEAVLRDFERDWPEVTCPRCVIPNGVDVEVWRPRLSREQSVLVVGRATPEKGLLEAAQAVAGVLPPDWRATFVISEASRNAAYYEAVRSALAPLGGRGRLLLDVSATEIRALNERAAIAVIPSRWREPFGRTCLEAHAGGAAVVSSGTGGLREISGDSALYLGAVTAADIAAPLAALIADADLRDQLAQDGRARILRLFALRRVANDFDNFCAHVIERASGD